MDKLLVFLGMAAVTFFTRFAMIAALGYELPSLVRRWLRYVPPAVLAALIAPAALAPQGSLEWGASAWAALAGTVVAWRTRSVIWTIAGGMAAFWLLTSLGV
ncbi:MAG: AzlD domain-containing protein [Chloroflexi bacterium]|nr:AzlD domain-containing protein [Chloroflexota bacterium]